MLYTYYIYSIHMLSSFYQHFIHVYKCYIQSNVKYKTSVILDDVKADLRCPFQRPVFRLPNIHQHPPGAKCTHCTEGEWVEVT